MLERERDRDATLRAGAASVPDLGGWVTAIHPLPSSTPAGDGPGLLEAEVCALGERGWFLRDGFAPADLCAQARAEAAALEAAGAMSPAALGRGASFRQDSTVRSDVRTWLVPSTAPRALARLAHSLEALRGALAREAWLPTRKTDLQLACFAPGARYQRHRDTFAQAGDLPGQANRRVTAIVYLNVGWHPEHGGALRIHGAEGPFDVAPISGRLAVFRSAEIEHEVLATRVPRYALTAWYSG
jgi:SM-20-related protein